MSQNSILIMDVAGTIVWANRLAHEIAGLPPGGLLGMNYLQITPPDTHGDLLKLHQRKLRGETVRFRIDLGKRRALLTTSGIVHVGERDYLFAVGRWAHSPPAGDEVMVGMLAAGELLRERRGRVDLNALLLSVLKEDASSLRGKVSLEPGDAPVVVVRPWPIRTVLRGLIHQAKSQTGRAHVSSGGDGTRAWVKVALAQKPRRDSAELAACRRIAREQGGRLQRRERVLTLSLPVAGSRLQQGSNGSNNVRRAR
ncbi:MAG TPA: PAS domain S-box protein [Planctomycetota bacterium]|nr:PAS domain S-box protein [Planctomycetota bacterium]